jgi:hypothetical protein
MDELWFASFKEKLDEVHRWPSVYMFKFIVPAGKEKELKELFAREVTSVRLSRQGRYSSLTMSLMMDSSDSVIAVYRRAAQVQGLIAL